MNSKEIREKYLNYFKKQGHNIIPSSSLVPENDPTTLFTSAGMQSMIPYLLGQKHPLGTRIVNSQKCLRSQDLDEVGDRRHTTFFEMLGNWSLNDYFKQEQLIWIFEFLTNEIGLNPQNLYVTTFGGSPENHLPKDEETVKIWKKLFKSVGIDAYDAFGGTAIQPGQRIFYYDQTKNWWSRSGVPAIMPEGELGGPDSEIFWDFGSELKLHEQSPWHNQPCHVNCDCGRFMEIGNNVFMEYIKQNGKIEKMAARNVDFGGGLERISAASLGNSDIFKIDLLEPIIKKIEQISGIIYNTDTKADNAMRIIADHLRSAVFLINDNVLPSNKAQGYFARRLIRRAIVKSQRLAIKNNFLVQIASTVANVYDGVYDINFQIVQNELDKEESRFRQTINDGLKIFKKTIANNAALSGKILFDLYQSYGFPLELSLEIAREEGIVANQTAIDEFYKYLTRHQNLSRTASAGMFKGGLADDSEQTAKLHTAAHLLLAALRKILGQEVVQKGSNITAQRLRFDFSSASKLTPAQIKQVEDLVNEQIQKNIPVVRSEMSLDEARAQGAIGVFNSKYSNRVAVYTIGDFSKEICGGPHAKNTGELGHFKIIKEESSSAGVRRIKAVLEPK